MFRILSGVAITAVVAEPSLQQSTDGIVHLFEGKHADKEAEKVFGEVYDHLLANFDVDAHHHLMGEIENGVASYLQSNAFNGYRTIAGQPHCDAGAAPTKAVAVKGMSAFPGGAVKRVFGFDLTKLVDKLAAKANGAAGAQGVFPQILSMQALSSGAGLVQSIVNSVLQVVPPMVPPPAWVNQPLPCMPQVTGHNCFGATPYMITAADFMTADVTDAQLDGVIAGFPALYKSKVGKTSDSAYKACFSAYMGMQCASIFPRCMAPMSRNEPVPVGRVPMCFTHCLATLVMCPGFWLNDIMGECQMVSVPPACTMAVFSNFALLPPQYSSFEESAPTPVECPTVPASLKNADASGDSGLYSSAAEKIAASPYSAGNLPTA